MFSFRYKKTKTNQFGSPLKTASVVSKSIHFGLQLSEIKHHTVSLAGFSLKAVCMKRKRIPPYAELQCYVRVMLNY
jgi:hypothetical protein